MPSRYVAFIVRLRLDEPAPGRSPEPAIHGSLQQVGSDQIQYFDSFERALEILKGTAGPPAESPSE